MTCSLVQGIGGKAFRYFFVSASGERLSWTRVRRLAYVNAEVRATDSFCAPPFGAIIGRALVNDGAVGSEPFVQKLVHPRVAWIAVGPEDVALSPPPG
jgi:hypothetical protein